MEPANQLIEGDNLEILKTLDSESVDLIYLDPPFFSNKNYELIWGDEGEIRSFQDRWSGGIDHYISWLKERVEQMHRVLKSTGAIFLHCDWHANAYIRTEILDKIFNYNNFRNEIIWKRTSAHSDSKRFGMNADCIFYYSKSNKYTFNPFFHDYDEKYMTRFRNDANGRTFIDDNLTAKSLSGGGYEYTYKGIKNLWRCPIRTMELYDKQGKLYVTNRGGIRLKRYLDELPGLPCQAIWTDINAVNSQAKEKIGYPTQKPQKLLQRIIECASNEGDLILDPFVGGGTTVAVADKLNRRWIGIDQSPQAIKVTEFRLNKQQDLFSKIFTVRLHKYDYDELKNKNATQFEDWIITKYGGQPSYKRGSDQGIDGKTATGEPIQVKRSEDVGVNVIKNFFVSAKQFNSKLFLKNQIETNPIGYIIAFSFTKGAVQETARLKNHENTIIKLVTVSEIIPIAKKPSLSVEINEIGRNKRNIRRLQFVASAKGGTRIKFFAWDFDYNQTAGKFKPGVLIDKLGKQEHAFPPGKHCIAVKVVDSLGIDNLEVVNLKVNGTLERA